MVDDSCLLHRLSLAFGFGYAAMLAACSVIGRASVLDLYSALMMTSMSRAVNNNHTAPVSELLSPGLLTL